MRPRRIRRIVGVGALLGLLVLIALFSPEAVCDGHFKVNISTRSHSSQAIKNVSCAFSFDRHDAEWLSQCGSVDARYAFKAVEDFDGKNYISHGRCSWREWWGIEYNYVADEFAVLRIDYVNGKQVTTVVEIPKKRGQRNISVEIP
jgi:hypothetical protein